jgi:hypothetical protein
MEPEKARLVAEPPSALDAGDRWDTAVPCDTCEDLLGLGKGQGKAPPLREGLKSTWAQPFRGLPSQEGTESLKKPHDRPRPT